MYNKEVAALVVDFLSRSKSKVDGEYSDSLDVAVDCITEAFKLDGIDEVGSIVLSKYSGKSLEDLIIKPAPTVRKQLPAATGKTPSEKKVHVDEKSKETAEKLKMEGNKAMASKNFDLAIEKYTQAIKLYPTNAVYYSNRAAAYSSLKKYAEAVSDAESAIEINPRYSKGYSRLGFAKYALGKPEEALEAYKKVLDLEGDKATEAMKRDFESTKRKVEQSLNLTTKDKDTKDSASQSSSKDSGFPDLSSILGGGGLGGGLGGLLNNPQVMEAAQKMMQNPGAMQEMLNNPAIKQMAQNFSSGNGTPNFSEMMKDPAIKDMASKFFGGGSS